MEISQEFVIEIFYSYCKRPTHKKFQNTFNAECPVCKEGKSSGRTRRLFYFPNKQYLYCHNCSKSWKPMEWIKEVSGLTLPEILKRNREKVGSGELFSVSKTVKEAQQPIQIPDLPEDSIDLSDSSQVSYYSDSDIVRKAIEYCKKRRLFTATNTCKKFYVSLEDKIHKNRLIIPFFNEAGKVVCYQSRALLEDQFPRYLTKFGEKEIFNVANTTSEVPYVFVFEGPIDSMFVKNGVALAALAPTERQQQQLQSLIGYEIIYVFDNDKNNPQTAKKIEKQLKSNKKLFIWPKEFQQYKDLNEVCCALGIDEVPWQFIVKHSASGPGALIKWKANKV